MKKAKSLSIFCLVLTLALFPLSVSFIEEAQAEAKTFKIGMITSMTGPMAPAFKPMFDAVKPTEELINQRGGITVKGQKYNIEIVAEDDQSSPQGAIAAANKMVQNRITFIHPPMSMICNLAITRITEEAKIVRIKSFGMGPAEVNPDTRYSFFSSASIHNIPFCYDHLKKNYPKVKKIAVITPDDPGVKTGLELTRRTAEEHGFEIVFQEWFKIPTEDFYPILTKALEKKPDAIDCVVSIVPWISGIIKQSRELGFTGPIYTPCIFGDINLVNSIIDKKYAYDIFHGGPDVLSDKMLPMVKDLQKLVEQTGSPFIMDSALPLDSVYLMIQAIEKAQSFDSEKVVETIESMGNIDTIWGPGRWGGEDLFGINHVVIRPFTFSRIMNGKVEFEFVKQ